MTKPKIPRNILIVAFVALASGFGQDMITPILPSFLILIGVSHAGIGIIDGLLQGTTSIFRFISGILSDRFQNRKWFIFSGYGLSSIARPLLALTGSFAAVATLRTIDGAGKGMKDAPRDALVADSATAETRGRAFGFQRFVDTAGSVFGPLATAGLLVLLTPSLHTYKIIFTLVAIPGIIALCLIFFGIKEPEKKKETLKNLSQPFSWKFWFFVIGMTIAMLTKINDSLFLTRAHEIGISATWLPVLFAGFTLVYALLSYPIGIWSDKIGKLPLIIAGWLVLTIVEFGFSHESSIGTALILFAFYGLFYALTEGSGRAIIADLVPPENRGSAYAIYNTFIGLAVIVGGFWIGKLWDTISPHYAFTISSYGSLLGFIILLAMFFIDRKQTQTL